MSTPLMGVSSFSPLEGENIRGGYAYHPHSLDLLRTGKKRNEPLFNSPLVRGETGGVNPFLSMGRIVSKPRKP
jgi:hypothetical protein